MIDTNVTQGPQDTQGESDDIPEFEDQYVDPMIRPENQKSFSLNKKKVKKNPITTQERKFRLENAMQIG